MEKINLEVTCKRDRFVYWNLCKRLPNFVNVAALLLTFIKLPFVEKTFVLSIFEWPFSTGFTVDGSLYTLKTPL